MIKRDSNQTLKGFSSHRSLFISSIGWLGGMSLLGAGIAYAQTAPTIDSAAVPSAQDLLQTAPESAPLEPSFSEVPAAPEPIAPVAEPEPSDQGAVNAGAVPEEALVSPNLADDARSAFEPASTVVSPYIDSTSYSLGATTPDVIFAERSTGCQAVVQPGQTLPSSICPEAPSMIAAAYSGGGLSSGGGGGYSVSSVALPSLQDFYNLTVRPPAKLSNSNLNLMFPLTIPAAITSVFGWRIHPIAGESRFHSGTDIGAPQGTPVLAAFNGKVQVADLMGGYGLAVVLRHNSDTEETLYGHMSEVFVKPGDTVKQGEAIGRVGSTGYSTGPHLHFEFRKLTPQGWTVLDPGQALQYSLAQLIKGVQPGQPKSLFASISWKSLKKALEMAEAKKAQPTAANPAVSPAASQPLSREL